jgi:hypothetical protein
MCITNFTLINRDFPEAADNDEEGKKEDPTISILSNTLKDLVHIQKNCKYRGRVQMAL